MKHLGASDFEVELPERLFVIQNFPIVLKHSSFKLPQQIFIAPQPTCIARGIVYHVLRRMARIALTGEVKTVRQKVERRAQCAKSMVRQKLLPFFIKEISFFLNLRIRKTIILTVCGSQFMVIIVFIIDQPQSSGGQLLCLDNICP